MKSVFFAFLLGLPAAAFGQATITHNVVLSYQAPSGVVTASIAVTNNAELNFNQALLSTDTQLWLTCPLTQSNLQSLCLYSPQTLTITPTNAIAPGAGAG